MKTMDCRVKPAATGLRITCAALMLNGSDLCGGGAADSNLAPLAGRGRRAKRGG